ncbi:hypothetical protein [Williamsia sp.]|uniref:hypothetical protein n=1 Tax=Williamsia sp. TaxID=1872085 RepID=UPI001A18D122|nr:hypothetical protein [Williamsia sp.]MBJ7290373.1 hypothetical protein [Williamsia sp.]
MTTPRPPRSNPPRRTPKVAGRAPARPATPPASETAPEQTTPEQSVPQQAAPEQTPPRKSRFSRKPKSDQPTEAPVAATPPTDASTDDAAPVEAPTAETPAAETPTADEPAADTAAVVETPTQADPVTTGPDATTDPVTEPEPDTESAAGAATATTGVEKTPAAAGDGPRGKNRPTTKVSTIKPQSTRPTAPPPVAAGESQKTPRGPLLGWKLVGIVTAVAVVFAIVAVIAAIKPGVSLSSNEAFVDSSKTSEVTSQANSRICSIFGVQYDKLDQWQQTAQSNVTGTAAQRFAEYDKAVRDALGQAGLTTGGVDCRVDSVGVRSIEGDSAVLAVNLILSQTQDQQASGSGTKRYQVSMQQVGGKWLVSNFADF